MSTPAGQAGATITEHLVVSLSATWRAIQVRHSDVPDVVPTLGSGKVGARLGEVTLGYFAASRWYTTGTTAPTRTRPAPATTVNQVLDQHT
ncbi:hypothetical protein [Pseudonocardia sp. GCM10023141]|uniref:hypothetical protein n=1 Tax=Pseudonocardia sp. GCM10023141 TaxID=3252653 RepID=UPI0036096C91